MVVLRADRTHAAECHVPPELRLIQYSSFEEPVVEIHAVLGRRTPLSRLFRRFERGLHFYVLARGHEPYATTWIVPRGERFVDEIGLGFRIREGAFSLRDVFVAPAARGRGFFALLVDTVANRLGPGGRTVWSAVEHGNAVSLHAHAKYGFRPVARFEVLHLMNHVLLRLRWPVDAADGAAYKPNRRVVVTGPSYRQFIEERLA